MQPHVDIAFDCLPLRSVGRIDVPIDASPAYRKRCERLQLAIERFGVENIYFLYNTRCIYRLANSDIENMLRFTFDGVVITDRSDAAADRAELTVALSSATCDPMPPEVLAWFHRVVERAVLIEFNHFIAAGRLAERVEHLKQVASVAYVSDFTAMNV